MLRSTEEDEKKIGRTAHVPGPKTPRFHQIIVQSVSAWFGKNLAHELENAEPVVWFVFSTMLGVMAYFAAPQEPVLAAVLGVLVVMVLATISLRNRGAPFFVASTMLGLALGFSAASFNTARVTPVLLSETFVGSIEGSVRSVEDSKGGGLRVMFDNVRLANEKAREKRSDIPAIVRLSVRAKNTNLQTGSRYRFNARLVPLSGPVIPGGFDFARDQFFKGIGATGFVFGAPELLQTSSVWRAEAVRQQIAERIKMAFEANGRADIAGIAMSLLVGKRGAITDAQRESLSLSGLAHILAISGLHMALVVVFVIGFMRRVFALHGEITLRHPIRHYAVGVGTAAGLGYFLISGGSVSATRAFVMMLIMVLAWLLGRRALSLRNVALAALLILLIEPSSLAGPGFQMSFMATLALVAVAKLWIFPEKADKSRQLPFFKAYALNALLFTRGILVTSLVAGLATALFAAFHFYKIAPLGLLSNLLGMPVFSLVVMPLGFLSLLVMPFGFEAYPLYVMGLGLDLILMISDQTIEFSRSVSFVGASNKAAFIAISLLLTLGFLLKSQLKYAVLAVTLPLTFLLQKTEVPTIFIAADAKTIMLQSTEGQLTVAGARSGRFDLKVWKEYLGKPPNTPHENAQCDEIGCIFRHKGLVIAQVNDKRGFTEDCHHADIVITRLRAPASCNPRLKLLDQQAFKTRGAHLLFAPEDPHIIRVETALPLIKRPWHAHHER